MRSCASRLRVVLYDWVSLDFDRRFMGCVGLRICGTKPHMSLTMITSLVAARLPFLVSTLLFGTNNLQY